MRIIKYIILFSILTSCDKSANYYYNLACDEEQKRNFDKAIQYLDKAISINPKDIVALNNRAFDNLELKHYDLAENDFKKMLELDANCPGAFYGLGFLNYQLKNYTKAIEYFDTVIKIKGGGPVFLEHVNNEFTENPYSMDVPIKIVYEYKKLSEIELDNKK